MKRAAVVFTLLFALALFAQTVGAVDVQKSGNALSSPRATFTGSVSAPASVQMEGDVNVIGNVTATSFTGSGTGLTGIPGTAISNTSITVNQIQNGAVTPGKISFYGNVRIVAPTGGDFTDPYTAMNTYSSWCPSPSANPCLLKIMPGVYNVGTLSVRMQPYIDIEGSGENTTVIQGSINSATSGVVNGASNAEIRFLTVENTDPGSNVIAIYNSAVSPKITNVTAIASGGSNSYGVYNINSGTIKINNSAIKGITSTIYNGTGVKTFVGNTQLDGGTVSNSGTLTCVGAYSATSYFTLGPNCQ